MGQCIRCTFRSIYKNSKKRIRAITFSEFSPPSEPLFQRINFLNFDKLVFQRICLLLIGDVPKPISDLFKLTTIITAIVHVTH